MAEFWREPDDNPETTLYAGKMVNPDRMFVWASDIRPYPHFPGNSAIKSDGETMRVGISCRIVSLLGLRDMDGAITDVWQVGSVLVVLDTSAFSC